MKKVYKKLTEDQTKRGVIFSSTLSTERTEQENDTTHEVTKEEPNKEEQITRLKNDSYFNKSHFKYNIIRGMR